MGSARSIGSHAFQWLDQHVVEALEAPDEAFDWVFMLKESDWPLLESVWDQRPPLWREAFAYVLCEGPVRPSQTLLFRAVFDADENVALQAAETLAHHREVEGDSLTFPPAVIERLGKLLL